MRAQELGGKLKALKVFRLLRLTKMLRLARMKRVLKRFDEEYPGIWPFSKLLSLILIILYVSHLFACLWYFSGSTNQTLDDGTELLGWVTSDGWNITEISNGVGWSRPYLDCYYYAVTTLTTVGYGDRGPTTDLEKVTAILTELAGGIIFGILAGTLSTMLMQSSAAEQRSETKMEELREFLTSKRVDRKLRKQIVVSMESFFRQKSAAEEETVLAMLPPKYKKSILVDLYKQHVMNCPLFYNMSEHIILKLCTTLHPYTAAAEDEVIRENEAGDEMYMVIRGDISIASSTLPKVHGKEFRNGAFFGELPVLYMGNGPKRNKHPYSAQVVASCPSADLAYLTRDDIERLTSDYSEFRTEMSTMARKRAARFGVRWGTIGLGHGGGEGSEDEFDDPQAAPGRGPPLRSQPSPARKLAPLGEASTGGGGSGGGGSDGPANAAHLAKALEGMKDLVDRGLMEQEAFNQMSAKAAEKLVTMRAEQISAEEVADSDEDQFHEPQSRRRGSVIKAAALAKTLTTPAKGKNDGLFRNKTTPAGQHASADAGETDGSGGDSGRSLGRSEGSMFFERMKHREKRPKKTKICKIFPRPTGWKARLAKACAAMLTIIVFTGLGNIIYSAVESDTEDTSNAKYHEFMQEVAGNLTSSQLETLLTYTERHFDPNSTAPSPDAKMWDFPDQDTFSARLSPTLRLIRSLGRATDAVLCAQCFRSR